MQTNQISRYQSKSKLPSLKLSNVNVSHVSYVSYMIMISIDFLCRDKPNQYKVRKFWPRGSGNIWGRELPLCDFPSKKISASPKFCLWTSGVLSDSVFVTGSSFWFCLWWSNRFDGSASNANLFHCQLLIPFVTDVLGLECRIALNCTSLAAVHLNGKRKQYEAARSSQRLPVNISKGTQSHFCPPTEWTWWTDKVGTNDRPSGCRSVTPPRPLRNKGSEKQAHGHEAHTY